MIYREEGGDMSKCRKIYKPYLNPQSLFDYYYYACWAANHSGWSKMKKLNRRIAKRRMRRADQKYISEAVMDDG